MEITFDVKQSKRFTAHGNWFLNSFAFLKRTYNSTCYNPNIIRIPLAKERVGERKRDSLIPCRIVNHKQEEI